MRVLFALALLWLVWSCGKEEVIKPMVTYDNIFEIKEDISDPIQSRVYNIYKKYGVSVFFNDTIGQVYIMDDVKGNPIYVTEKIDLAWTFSAYSKQTYVFEYMYDVSQKAIALDIIEEYLENASPSLYPFSFFVTQSGQKIDKETIVESYRNSSFLIGFRTIYMTGNWTEVQKQDQPDLMKKQMILNKITNYPDDIAEFAAVSKSIWYGGLAWTSLDPTLPANFPDVNALYDNWTGAKWYTAAELESMRINARKVIGKFGFVKGNHFTEGLQTPSNSNYDMQDYITEMLKYSVSEFKELWGAQPLVMKKYNILLNVIENKMEVKL